MGVPMPGGGNDSGSNNYNGFGSTYTIDTNELYLEITGVSNGAAWFSLHRATDSVYEVWSRIDLHATNWDIEQEVWPGTNLDVAPFTVPQLDRTNLFIWARDWTGVDENSNGIPDWWEWKYFGGFNQPTNGDYDSDGVDNLTEYLNGNDPNKIRFSLQFPNDHVSTGIAYGMITIWRGVPNYMAVLVNDTNLADANWQPYTSSNVLVNLNAGDGSYSVLVGLRGLPSDAQQMWQKTQIILNTVPPVLTITNPIGDVSTQPIIQLQGYADEPLSSLTFDVSNAVGIISNQLGYLTGRFYDTNLLEFTTDWFQCHDVNLADGLNTITLHATDLAGNTASVSVALDYSADTNPPVFTLVWPQAGTAVSGDRFTLLGQVDDLTATVAASIVDASGNTNTVQGLVEQNSRV